MVTSSSDFTSCCFGVAFEEDVEVEVGGLEVEGPGSISERSESTVS